jgi:hypothetical protein
MTRFQDTSGRVATVNLSSASPEEVEYAWAFKIARRLRVSTPAVRASVPGRSRVHTVSVACRESGWPSIR